MESKDTEDSENQTDMLTLISEGKNDHADSDKNDGEHPDSQQKTTLEMQWATSNFLNERGEKIFLGDWVSCINLSSLKLSRQERP